jgi:3',5'-cyclic AMP phosphodiesterase CpdA
VIAQISDFHVRCGDDPDGSVPALDRAVDAVLRLRPLPDAVLLSGDLADTGSPAEYALVRERLAPLPMPVHPLPGNHDDPAALARAFGLPAARYSVRCGPLRLVACDSSVPGRDGGRLDTDWLDAELAADADTPTVVAVHHAPITTGLVAVDAIGLDADSTGALAAVVARHPQVRCIASGHIHRGIAGRLGSCPVVVCPGTNIQLKLDLTPRDDYELVREPTGLVVHVLAGGEVVSHFQPI